MKADVWGLGMTMYFIATGTLPFAILTCDTLLDLMEKLQTRLVIPKLPKKLTNLLQGMLKINPEDRFDCHDMFLSPYLREHSIIYSQLFSSLFNLKTNITQVSGFMKAKLIGE
jgi:serine/threonine protein kinase